VSAEHTQILPSPRKSHKRKLPIHSIQIPRQPNSYSGFSSSASVSRVSSLFAAGDSNRFAALFGGGVGAPSPAVSEPNPNFCNVGASNFPVGFKPFFA